MTGWIKKPSGLHSGLQVFFPVFPQFSPVFSSFFSSFFFPVFFMFLTRFFSTKFGLAMEMAGDFSAGYLGGLRRRLTSRGKCPNPQLLLQHQFQPITLRLHHHHQPSPSPPITLRHPPRTTPDGTHATQGNGDTIHTPRTQGVGMGAHDVLATRRTERRIGQAEVC